MKRIIVLLIILFSIFTVYANEIINYDYEVVGLINLGIKDGELGKDEKEIMGITPAIPGPLFISNSKKLYIFDEYNNRINVYDISLNYLYKIDLNYEKIGIDIFKIYNIKFDEKENLYLITAGIEGREFVFIDNNKNVTKIPIPKSKEVYSRFNFFPLQNRILYSTKNDIKYFDFLNTRSNINIDKFYYGTEKNRNIINEVNRNELVSFLQKNKIILNGNRLLTTNNTIWLKYYEFLDNNTAITKKIIINKKISMESFLGFDDSDNVYWRGPVENTTCIIVYNILGEIIGCFKSLKGGIPAIAPNGDIYSMETTDEKVTVYKITRRW